MDLNTEMNRPDLHTRSLTSILIFFVVFILCFFLLEGVVWFVMYSLDLESAFWNQNLYLNKNFLIMSSVMSLLFATLIVFFIRYHGRLRYRISEQINDENSLFENIPFQIIMKDHLGRITRVNQAVTHFYGLKKEDFTGRKEEAVFPDLQAQYYDNNEYVYRKKEAKYNIQETRTHHEGEKKVLKTDRIPIFDVNGDFKGVMVVAEDITTDIVTNQQIRESGSRLEKIIESLQEGVTLTTPDGYFEIYNSQMRDITGYTKEEANKTRDFINLIYPDPNQRQIVLDAMDDIRQTGRSNEAITEIVTRDRQQKLILVSTVLVTFNEKIRFLSTYRDVTDLFHIQEQVTLFSRAVEQGASTVLIVDRNGYIQYSNIKFSELTGFERDEVIGQHLGFNLLKSDNENQYADMWQSIEEGREWQGEWKSHRKNGDVYWTDMTISPILDTSGTLTHFIVIENDITERRRVIEMLKNARDLSESANRAKTEFLANMSHELRTPLNSIIGFTNILLKSGKKHFNERETMFMERIRDNGINLLNILSDILEISMIEAGKVSATYIPADITNILEEPLKKYQEAARNKGLEIKTNMPDTINSFETDPDMLKAIIDNLLSNAVKFTEKGRITVSVQVNPNTNEPAELIIADTGPGIPEERLKSIFKAFEQVDYSKARRYGGTGLGLALANSYAELMNYHLLLDTEVDKGSTFTIRFY
jgi:PAS domain S-box-containing protein